MEPTLARLCRVHLGREPDDVQVFQRADGSRHGSMRLTVGGESIIATHRSDPRRGQLEAMVLQALHDGGAPVPRVLAFEDGWLLQEDVGRTTLAQALWAPDADRIGLLEAALDSLERAVEVGRALGIPAPQQSYGAAWARRRLHVIRQIGDDLGLPLNVPEFEAAFVRLLQIPGHAFIKQDARPANAAVTDRGVVWFDWEHACRRWPADDLVWLLCDEAQPDPLLAGRLLATRVAAHPDACPTPPRDYLAVAAVHHVAWRIGLHVRDLRKVGDHPFDLTIARDWTGSSEVVRHLAHAGALWARIRPVTEPLVGWFRAIETLDRFDRDRSDPTQA